MTPARCLVHRLLHRSLLFCPCCAVGVVSSLCAVFLCFPFLWLAALRSAATTQPTAPSAAQRTTQRGLDNSNHTQTRRLEAGNRHTRASWIRVVRVAPQRQAVAPARPPAAARPMHSMHSQRRHDHRDSKHGWQHTSQSRSNNTWQPSTVSAKCDTNASRRGRFKTSQRRSAPSAHVSCVCRLLGRAPLLPALCDPMCVVVSPCVLQCTILPRRSISFPWRASKRL
jgi:hypothetical protein